jgi:uncharacterized protein (TIGR03382 family)
MIFASACGTELVREDQVSPEVSAAEQAITACAGPNTVQGIDVSAYQPNTNWGQVAGAGKKFAIIKATEGTGYVNSYFARDWAGAKAAGLIRGAYHFFHPGTDPTAQADHFVNTVGALGVGDLPMMLDLEATDGLGPAAVAASTRTFLNRVQARSGRVPIIYTGYYFWTGSVGNPGGYGGYPLIMAAYVSGCPLIPNEWSKFTMWQYSSSGVVAGVSGHVDLDEFNGTLADLQALASPPAPPNAPPRGALDVADGTQIAGWAQDPDVPTQSIAAHIYFNAPAGGAGAIGVPLTANLSRADLCTAIGSCNHGFVMSTPLSLCDGQPHQVHAYGIDSAGGNNPEIGAKTLTCSIPAVHGYKRHVVSTASMTAWGFTAFNDVAPVSDAVLMTLSQSGDWPTTPDLVRVMGTQTVYVLDQGFRRVVGSPAIAAAWNLDLTKVKEIAATDLTQPEASPLRPTPRVVKGTGTAIYVIDDPLPLNAQIPEVPMTVIDTEVLAPLPVPGTGGGDGTDPNPRQTVTGGCSASGLETMLPLLALVLLGLRRRSA